MVNLVPIKVPSPVDRFSLFIEYLGIGPTRPLVPAVKEVTPPIDNLVDADWFDV
jgi:hypothetical protein